MFNIIGDGVFGFIFFEFDMVCCYGLLIINIIYNNVFWGVIKMG